MVYIKKFFFQFYTFLIKFMIFIFYHKLFLYLEYTLFHINVYRLNYPKKKLFSIQRTDWKPLEFLTNACTHRNIFSCNWHLKMLKVIMDLPRRVFGHKHNCLSSVWVRGSPQRCTSRGQVTQPFLRKVKEQCVVRFHPGTVGSSSAEEICLSARWWFENGKKNGLS